MSFNDTVIFQDNLSQVINERTSMTQQNRRTRERNQFQCHLSVTKSRKDWPKVVLGAPRWEAGEKPAEPRKACNLFNIPAWQKTRCYWNVMAHAQKPDFVFRRKARVHLNRRRRQFSRLLAAELCASALVMLDTTCSVVAWRVLATRSIRQFPLHFPARASPCAIIFQLDFTALSIYITDGVSIPEEPASKHRWGNSYPDTIFVVFFSNSRQISGKYLGYVTANSKFVVVEAGDHRTLALARAGNGIGNWAGKHQYIKNKSAPTYLGHVKFNITSSSSSEYQIYTYINIKWCISQTQQTFIILFLF